MFTLPILTFFVVRYVAVSQNFSGPDNWAGAAAILVTNGIVGGYCYSAYKEDLEEKSNNHNNTNDADAPRVGIYKQRVD